MIDWSLNILQFYYIESRFINRGKSPFITVQMIENKSCYIYDNKCQVSLVMSVSIYGNKYQGYKILNLGLS